MVLIYAIKQDKLRGLFIASGFILFAGTVFRVKSPALSTMLFALALLLFAISTFLLIRRNRQQPGQQA